MRKNIIALITIFIVSGLLIYRFRYVCTPQYTLNRIKNSMLNHDWVEFQKWVDVDIFVLSIIDDFIKTEDSTLTSNIAKSMIFSTFNFNKNELCKLIEYPSDSVPIIFNEIMNSNLKLKPYKTVGNLSYMAIPVESKYIDTTFSFSIEFRKKSGKYYLTRVLGRNIVNNKLEDIKIQYCSYVNRLISEKIDSIISIELSPVVKYRAKYYPKETSRGYISPVDRIDWGWERKGGNGRDRWDLVRFYYTVDMIKLKLDICNNAGIGIENMTILYKNGEYKGLIELDAIHIGNNKIKKMYRYSKSGIQRRSLINTSISKIDLRIKQIVFLNKESIGLISIDSLSVPIQPINMKIILF